MDVLRRATADVSGRAGFYPDAANGVKPELKIGCITGIRAVRETWYMIVGRADGSA
jgi:hypothetical protein